MYQTIEQILLNTEIKNEVMIYSQDIIEGGKKGLTPIKEWFLEQKFVNPNFYNQSVLFVSSLST